jgi:glycosyltransferase involved in cell wall biosynthesis
MTDNPKISVAMACFNVQRYIKAAIKSVVRQSYNNWEIIIVNDGSTDKTAMYIDMYLKELGIQDKVKTINHKRNMGYGTALANAIENGSGELVAVVDADDKLAGKYAFSTMVDAHRKHPNASLVYSTYYACYETISKEVIKDIKPIPPGMTYLDCMMTMDREFYRRVSHLKVFKRAMYNKTGGLKRGLLKAVDRDLVLKLEEVGDLVFIDKPLYFHRKNLYNITHRWADLNDNQRKEILEAKEKMFEDAKKRRGLK